VQPGSSALPAGTAVGQPVGYGEPPAHDERAGGGDEGSGELARRIVSWLYVVAAPEESVRYGVCVLIHCGRFMAASKVLGEDSVRESGR
jgi:hypothetical protein